MEDNVMERKFGNFTLDELKKACEICLDDKKVCSDGCPMGKVDCGAGMNKSVLELIDVYKASRKMHQYWFTEAQELYPKANKYDSVRNELIRTQELLKNAQDECRKRADKIKDMREEIDALHSELDNVDHIRANLHCKLSSAEAVQKSLNIKIKDLEGVLAEKQTVIDRLLKEKDETNAELLHYHVLLGSLKAIGKAIFNDESGNHEKD